MALLILGVTLHSAGAKPYNAGNMSKGGFIAACEGVEGKVSKKGTVIRCDFPNGTYETCNFKKGKPVICNYIPIVAGDNSNLIVVEWNSSQNSGITASHADPAADAFTTDDDTR